MTATVVVLVATVLGILEQVNGYGDVEQPQDDWPECDLDWNHANPSANSFHNCIPKVKLVCQPGEKLVGASCIKTLIAENVLKCPHFSELVGEKCINSFAVESSPVCADGYELVGGKRSYTCQRIEVISASVTCDDNYQISQGLCTKVHSHKPLYKCPSGQRMSHNKLSCLSEVLSTPRLLCPPGFQLSHGRGLRNDDCARVVTVPADAGCLKDYEFHDGSCVKLDRIKMYKQCPKGFTQQDNFCVKNLVSKSEWDCPNGYHLKGTFCEAIVTVSSFPVCPKHFEYVHSECVRESKHNVAMVCPKGSYFSKGECVSVAYVENQKVCPPGAWLNGKQYCVTAEVMVAELRCPPHYTQDHEGNCVKHDKKPLKFICEKGFGLDADSATCSRIHKYKAEMKCDGHKLVGNKCESIHEVAPEKVCRKGEMNQFGDCVSTHKKHPEGFCQRGYTASPSQPGLCMRRVTAQAEMVCAPGSEFKGGKCAICTTLPAEMSCPRNYHMSPDGGCQQTVTMNVVMECPDGFVYDQGMCYPMAESNLKKKDHDRKGR